MATAGRKYKLKEIEDLVTRCKLQYAYKPGHKAQGFIMGAKPQFAFYVRYGIRLMQQWGSPGALWISKGYVEAGDFLTAYRMGMLAAEGR